MLNEHQEMGAGEGCAHSCMKHEAEGNLRTKHPIYTAVSMRELYNYVHLDHSCTNIEI